MVLGAFMTKPSIVCPMIVGSISAAVTTWKPFGVNPGQLSIARPSHPTPINKTFQLLFIANICLSWFSILTYWGKRPITTSGTFIGLADICSNCSGI